MKKKREYVSQFSEVMDVMEKYDHNVGECRNCRKIDDLVDGICGKCRTLQYNVMGNKKANYSIYSKWTASRMFDNDFIKILFVAIHKLVNPFWYIGVGVASLIGAFIERSVEFFVLSMILFLVSVVLFFVFVFIPRRRFAKINEGVVKCGKNQVWECPSCKKINIGIHMCLNCGVFPKIISEGNGMCNKTKQ